ncbi:MAG: methyltransferase domain-containing protein, partial [Bacteroidota bacterium]
PDAQLLEQLRLAHPTVDACLGTLADLDEKVEFDTIVYIDVLEHIEDDGGELECAAKHLAPDGHLVVLSPAHQWLFTPFDAAIGHHRRYNRPMLRAITPPTLRLATSFYLDSVGMVLASAANKVLLQQAAPTAGQIALWDRVMVPMSRLIDPLLRRRTGKTVVGVWTPQRDGA